MPGGLFSRQFERGLNIVTPPEHGRWAGGRIFYGWVIVGAAALAAFGSGPGQSYVFSVFLDSIISDTGLSRSGISALYLVSTAVSALMVSVVSRMADRFGPRTMLVVVGLAFPAACFGMATLTNLTLFYVAFVSLRALGQGSLPINATLLVNQWFISRRGLAIAIMGLGMVFSTAILPPLARLLIDSIGWREAYAFLGTMSMVLVVVPAVLFVRNRPEDIGLFPDGKPHPPLVEARQAKPGSGRDRRVLSTPAFWLLALPLATPSLVSTALMFHQTSIFVENGLSANLAAGVFVIYAAASAVTSMIAGVVVDRTGPKILFGLVMALFIVSLVLAVAIDSIFFAALYIVVLGIAGGFHSVVQGVIWAHYYGRHRLGRIQGTATTIGICGSAVGPLPLALLHDMTGTYTAGIVVMVALPVLSLVSITLARPKGLAG
ncbi:MAG: MFS transporter [Dehalococcoidia bacterium]|nr:MFS transporter [Dehalococcoidia bacterium]